MSRLRDNINGSSKNFRKMLGNSFITIPGVYSGISALIAERVGFRSIYLSGSGIAGMMGLPDLSITTLDEVVREAGNITSISRLPLIVDCDTGFGEPLNVMRTVRLMERAGVAAIHIEDQELPKKCGHLNGKKIVPAEDFIAKIRAAKEASKDPNFSLIARTDARSVGGLDDAIERSREYLKAGADIIFTEALENPEEFREMRKKVNGYLMANMTEFGKSPLLSVDELKEIGYDMVIFPLTAFRSILKNTEQIYSDLHKQGTQRNFIDKLMTRSQYYELIGYSEYEDEDYLLASRKNK
ncbi:methylisocitrate lyase [Cuniculiplasma divulgatum]|uniref:Methylisocitrate lyase n=1 Tax=Cuniculiplasma divulgatum TaxID=1673428 RepID=A0A1N5VT47_9ARCH|nr:methylisocitrate lyase [Cuniculiplasma divulgatum]MCL4320750.1 methylisocitrate lyase [Candidatus Thermoplasmatota archaeon]SIM76026.1 carboxyvinyl-carboxyphosphonate phosphorylmutase [Cuniculiplasma divulgatum]